MADETIFETEDTKLATFLLVSDCKHVGYRRDGRTVFFQFDDKARCLALRDDYLMRRTNEARYLHNVFKAYELCKDIIFGT